MIRFLILFLLLCSCNKSDDTKNDATMAKLRQKADVYIDLILDKKPHDVVDRCDGLTFWGLFYAYGVQDYPLYKHEYKSGQWHRDVKPCYPKDSRSEISLENILGVLHALWSTDSLSEIDELVAYGDTNQWVLGTGPTEYTRMLQLTPLIYKMRAKLQIADERKNEDAIVDVWAKIKGYRGNVVADYLTLKGKVYGYLNPIEMKFMQKAVENVPQNPVYRALCAQYGGESFEHTFEILLDENKFPSHKLPDDKKQWFDWGNAPAGIVYIFVVNGILNGL